MNDFINELKRRNVFRVGIAYAVIAWVIAQVAELALDNFEAPAWVMKTLLLVLALGFPLAVFFAWAFEMTPEGIKKEHEVDRSQSITSHTGRKLDFVIIGLLVVAVGVLLFDKFQSTPSDEMSADSTQSTQETVSGQQSIAVLPFTDLSENKDQEYFSDGLAEELLNVLVRIKSIKVASRTSSFAFKGKDAGIPQIAEALKVDHILEGSVRKAGDTVRVTAQLIDVKSDRHLWSDTYQRDLKDIFAIQDEIAGKIVEALHVALGTGEQAALSQPSKVTDNFEAYEYYLRGRSLWQRRGETNIKKAITLLEQATQLDPKFARAWSTLAAANMTLPSYSPTASAKVQWELSEVQASRALALDDNIAEAYAVLADLARDKKRWQEAEGHYQRAIALEPGSVTAQLWYCEFLGDVGRLQEALKHCSLAADFDPLSPGANLNLAGQNRMLGNYDTALKHARITFDLGHYYASELITVISLAMGDYTQAAAFAGLYEVAAGIPAEKHISKLRVKAFEDPALRPELLRRLAQMKGAPDMETVPWFVEFGDLDGAFAMLPIQREDWANRVWYLWDIRLAPLRQDPRFKEVMREAGLVDYWRSNTWADFCHPRGDDFYCE